MKKTHRDGLCSYGLDEMITCVKRSADRESLPNSGVSFQLDGDRREIITEEHLAHKQPEVSLRNGLSENQNKRRLNINVELNKSNQQKITCRF